VKLRRFGWRNTPFLQGIVFPSKGGRKYTGKVPFSPGKVASLIGETPSREQFLQNPPGEAVARLSAAAKLRHSSLRWNDDRDFRRGWVLMTIFST
jgi:hypothetical protein